ncbi:hypothetical protein MAIT1_02319 [Magnetofaba australis IT-1]|uniref:Uncharacterized protein n=1 Tax=Magnetofaba australis IT-1 TaxID=1434232 RepID=A0A1Y2K513_9PROT|nr:hypothetical protein MAIT1_02319 [Magnetofaba australis IT-1]
MARILPEHDPNWESKWRQARERYDELMRKPPPFTQEESDELVATMKRMEEMQNRRFRTTADYRDHHFARAQEALDRVGVSFELPELPDHATLEEIDSWLNRAWRAIDVTMTENF